MAGGQKLVREISDQFLNCKICFESFKNPKTLTCLHTFCTDCLQQHVDSESTRSRFSIYNRYVTCPICRKKTDIPTGGIRRLPDNFLLSNLTEIIDRRRPSKIPPCEICHTVRPRSNDACAKCLDCSKLLCKACVELHHETKVTQNHSLIDVEGEKDIECKSHPEEIVRFYCEPCDSCICVVCTFQEHRDHEICSFSEGYSKYKSAMESLVEKCRKRIDSVNERVETINKCENALKKTRENIRDLAISYIQQVRSTERELLKSVDNYLGENVVSFLENRDWLQENADELQTACNLTEIVMRDRGVEMLLLKKEMQCKLNSLLEPALPTLPTDVLTDIQFNPGEVKFGTLSFQDDEDEKMNGSINGHIDQKESSLKSNNSCMKTTEMQTDNEKMVNSATSMASDMSVSYRDSKNQTRSIRTITKGTETEKINSPTVSKETETDDITLPKFTKAKHVETRTRGIMTEKEVLLSHKVQTDIVQTRNRETYTNVESANVAMNTLPITTVSKGLQVFSDPGTPGSGICVQCCEELTNEKPPSGKPPKIQDIIILNTVDKDGREWRRRRRSLIRSKRVQTDLSMTSPLPESVSLPSLHKVPERSLSCGSTEYLRPEMHTIALDPIWDDDIPKRAPSYKRRMRDKTTNTSFKLKPVVDTWDVGTYTDSIRTKTFATMTSIDVNTIDTQTCRMNQVDQGIATDFSGQTEKSTSTLAVELIDSETSMPTVCFDDKLTWTEPPATAERAMCTDRFESSDMSTETAPVDSCDQGLQVTPSSHDTATEPILMSNKDQMIQVQLSVDDDDSQSSNRKSWHAGTSLFAKLFKSKSSSTSNSEQDLSASALRPDVKLIDASTETLSVVHCDKETATQRTTQTDQWTLTPSPVMVNTGISPKRPLTMESGVETNHVTFMDQSTYTEVVQYKDSETETVIIVQDNETLTERVKLQDAQTFIQISNETDETNTDPVIVMDANVSTDKDWLDKLKPETSNISTETVLPDLINSSTNTVAIKNYDISTSISSGELIQCIDRSTGPIPTDTRDRGTMALSFGQPLTQFNDMDTQTTEVRLYDKSVCTSGELEEFDTKSIEYSDMATSTESLPYIGLLSELEGDELFLIPESAFDLATNEPILEERDPVEMVDDGTTTDFISANEMSTQTIISSAWPFEDDEAETTADLKESNGKTLLDIGINTAPKLTFEKGTSTPIRHLFSKGTMTFYIAKTDKATSTFNQAKHIAETCYGNKSHDKVNKVTMTNVDVKDVGTITDSSLMDEKMAACISKLRNVSERLQSPTFKTAPSFPWSGRSDSPVSSENSSLTNSFTRESELSPRQAISDDERRKHIMELVAQTETYIKPKDGKCDFAPGRKAQPITTLKGKLAPPSTDDETKSKSLPREYTEQGSESPKNGERNSPSRLPRYNSAPGRIATVPTQKMKKNMQGSKIPVCQKGQDHSKGVLPAITESRTPSTCSESDSFVSAASDNSSDANLDFSSLKIHVPPSRLSPCSFLSVPEEYGPEESATAQLHETPVEAKPPANVGFMKKLFSKNSKKRKNAGSHKQQQQPQQPHQDKQGKSKQHPKHAAEPPKPKSPKPPKKQPFVYIRQRVFSIQQDNVEELKKLETETKYMEKPADSVSKNDDRPPSTYDNL